MKIFFLLLVSCFTLPLFAQHAVLYTGSDWCQISPHVQTLWQDADFQKTVGVSTVIVDMPDVQPKGTKKDATLDKFRISVERLPAVGYFNSAGRCVYLVEGLSATTTKEDLKIAIAEGRMREKLFDSYLATNTVDSLGQMYRVLQENVGEWRAKAPVFTGDILKKIQALDPEDKSGWHFALTFFPTDGVCYEIQKFATEKKFEEGEARIAEIKAKPQEQLTLNQRQAIALLPFVLYKDVPAKREACVEVLKQVVAMGTETHFGAGALGYLCMWGEGPVAVPYGWRAKHVSTGTNKWTVSTGIKRYISGPGRYAINIKRTKGSGKMSLVSLTGNCLSLETSFEKPVDLVLHEGKDIIFETTLEGPMLNFILDVENPTENEGAITIRRVMPLREVLEEKVDLKPYQIKPRDPIVKRYAWTVLKESTFEKILAREGGASFLKAFFDNQVWMEDFFASGDPSTTWDNALLALDAIYYHSFKETMPTDADLRWATAAALNAQEDPSDVFYALQVLLQTRKELLLIKGMDDLRVDQMRFVFATSQGDAASMAWIVKQHHVSPSDYAGVCWFAAYRVHNFFGDSIHGPIYYRPWDHVYVRHETARKIGGVCGSLSHYGCMAARAHGLPATTGGQPAHCAYNLWQPRMLRWEIDYNVNPYTGAHFLPWKNVYSFSMLDLQNELFAHSKYRDSMRALWTAEILRGQLTATPKLSPMKCVAYAWQGKELPKSLALLEVLGRWEAVENFAINRVQKDYVCYVWKGTLTMPQTGEVMVDVRSDDGARLWIDGKPVAGEDGVHAMRGTSKTLKLKKGVHRFELRYFNFNYGAGLEVSVEPVEKVNKKVLGLYRLSGKLCPVNLHTWRAYANYLKKCGTFKDARAEWVRFAKLTARGMGHHLEPVWDLIHREILPTIEQLLKKEEVAKILIDLHRLMKQGEHETAEFCDYERILNDHEKRLSGKSQVFDLFNAVLTAQFGTRDAFGRVIRWGSGRFLEDKDYASRYIAALNEILDKEDGAGDVLGKYVRDAIIGASNAQNIAAFQSLCDLQDRLKPVDRAVLFNEEEAKQWGYLCSANGLLRISSTSQWDHPSAYRHVIDDKVETDAFHTREEVGPWAEVELAGPSEVSRVFLKNTTGNIARLVPFVVEVSEDGKKWQTVVEEATAKRDYTYTFPPVKGQYVRVRCTGANKTFLHLRKMMIYGKKLY